MTRVRGPELRSGDDHVLRLVSDVRALFIFDGWRRIMTGAEQKAVCRLQPALHCDLAVNVVQNASTGIGKIV